MPQEKPPTPLRKLMTVVALVFLFRTIMLLGGVGLIKVPVVDDLIWTVINGVMRFLKNFNAGVLDYTYRRFRALF